MKHTRPLARMPEIATTTDTTTGLTPFAAKVEFLVQLTDRIMTYVFQKQIQL